MRKSLKSFNELIFVPIDLASKIIYLLRWFQVVLAICIYVLYCLDKVQPNLHFETSYSCLLITLVLRIPRIPKYYTQVLINIYTDITAIALYGVNAASELSSMKPHNYNILSYIRIGLSLFMVLVVFVDFGYVIICDNMPLLPPPRPSGEERDMHSPGTSKEEPKPPKKK